MKVMATREENEQQWSEDDEEEWTVDDEEEWTEELDRKWREHIRRSQTKWARRLHAFIADRRLHRPLPTPDNLTDLEQQQIEVICRQLPELIRNFSSPKLFTSNRVGLLAIQRLYPTPPENLFVMYQDEYHEFCDLYEKDMLRQTYHNYWNLFDPSLGEDKRSAHPTYEQRMGSGNGPTSGSFQTLIWTRDGQELRFLAEGAYGIF